MLVENRFGKGELYTIDEVYKEVGITGLVKVYCESTACMSVTSDMMSWVSSGEHRSKIAFVDMNKPGYNNVIIVLGCQVTDLAILNDINKARALHEENPEAKVFMGGCLAYRFDIPLPGFISRLGAVRTEYQEITPDGKRAVHWAKPFWVDSNKFDSENGDELGEGHIFRDMYPLKIGAGCHGRCRYCTIRDTRGNSYETDAYLQVKEFISHDNVVLISDSPTPKQIKDWCQLAIRYNKPISIRNVEPSVVCQTFSELIDLAQYGLLHILHCPIQFPNVEVLRAMNRSTLDTVEFIGISRRLRSNGVLIATNVIIDYTVPGNDGSVRTFPPLDTLWMHENFDYWSWNPYFDGHYDEQRAIERWNKYLPNKI